jgi:hypothetical protein
MWTHASDLHNSGNGGGLRRGGYIGDGVSSSESVLPHQLVQVVAAQPFSRINNLSARLASTPSDAPATCAATAYGALSGLSVGNAARRGQLAVGFARVAAFHPRDVRSARDSGFACMRPQRQPGRQSA